MFAANIEPLKAQEKEILTTQIVVSESGPAYYGYIVDTGAKTNDEKTHKSELKLPPLPDKPIWNSNVPAMPDLDRSGNKKAITLPPLPDRDKWGDPINKKTSIPVVIPRDQSPVDKWPPKKLDPKSVPNTTYPKPAPIPKITPIPQKPKTISNPKNNVISGKIVGRQCGWVTAYSPGNSGTLTANGKNVFRIPHKFVAHRSYKFGTKVYEVSESDLNSPDVLNKVKSFFGYKEDYGPNVSTGHDLDLWMRSDSAAIEWGRRYKCWVAVE
jgi:3D (Asp-Asp-Asp) domain-containing protein